MTKMLKICSLYMESPLVTACNKNIILSSNFQEMTESQIVSINFMLNVVRVQAAAQEVGGGREEQLDNSDNKKHYFSIGNMLLQYTIQYYYYIR